MRSPPGTLSRCGARPLASATRTALVLLTLAAAAPAQTVWSPRASGALLPEPRMQHALAYDAARGRLVLFGGASTAAPGLFGDTWEWDGQAWSQRTPAVSPPPRAGHALAYDAVRQRVVLFGGTGGASGWLGDTWTWDGTTWTPQATPLAPTPRHAHALAWDGSRQRIVLFGGDTAAGVVSDTWEWNGVDWVQRFPAMRPAPRRGHALGYDAVRARLVLFGGERWNGTGYVRFADTWVWDGTSWTLQAPATSPPASARHGLVWDGGALLLFGGVAAATPSSGTWRWDGTDWAQQFVASPPERRDAPLAFDAGRGRVVLFGGWDGTTPFADHWEWSGAAWTQLPPGTMPGARRGHALAYDAARGQTVMFGGSYGTGTGLAFPAGTWTWDGARWTAGPAGGPGGRSDLGLAYDEARQRVVLFGGVSRAGTVWTVHDDTWEWDGAGWQQRFPATRPPARSGHALAWDAVRQRVLMFGGMSAGVPVGDTWAWDGTDWTRLTPPSSPGARHAFALASDLARGRVVLFGGWAGTLASDTWEWDGTTWAQQFVSTFPPARAGAATAYDAARARVVLFGGASTGAVSAVYQADTWEWDGTSWVERAVPAAPPGREGALACDRLRGSLVLYGGFDGWVRGDTWEYGAAFPATYVAFGSACAGSAGIPALVPSPPFARPWIGGRFAMEARPLPAGSATWILFGALPFPAGIDLGPAGMPGCALYASTDLFVPVANPNGTARLSLPVPDDTALVGGIFYNQAFVMDPINPLGLISTNGREARIGVR